MSIPAESACQLFEQMSAEGIPLSLSVPFLIRVRGWQVQYFCRDIGVHRGYFNALLNGLSTPGFNLRMAVRTKLGFDPWQTNAGMGKADAGNTGSRAGHGSASIFVEPI